MNTGTKSVLFGVHQFILHPIIVLYAWLILYGRWPKFYQLCAIITHDMGYFGKPNMDGTEGETHPQVMATWWQEHFGYGPRQLGDKVAKEILGHSRYHAKKNGLPLSKLFRPDKLSTALYPRWLYLLLGTMSGEIKEYMSHCEDGKYKGVIRSESKILWLIEVQAKMALMGIEGETNMIVKQQMQAQPVELEDDNE